VHVLIRPMVSILNKRIGTVTYCFVLCLSLSHVTHADEYRNFDPCAEILGSQPNPEKCGKKTQEGIHTVKGEILHINGANLLVKKNDGEEVLLHIDLSTQVGGKISPGNRIEAKVNEVEGEKHVLSINKAQ
jgi:hypothetical protein